MSAMKVLVAVGAMVACLAVIYPWLVQQQNKDAGESVSPEKHKAAEGLKPHTAQVNADKSMGSAPHPGIRAAADVHKHQAQPGSGRGIMGLILPIYAVGIVLYLVYTLFKVFNKSKKDSWSQEGTHYDHKSGRELTVDRMGFPLDYDGSGDVHNFLNDHQQKRELEDLLARVDNPNVSVNEMRLLQKRLEETEAQMSRILMAMQTVQTNVDRMGVVEDEEEVKRKPIDLSPDMDSYEVVGREEEMDENVKESNNVTKRMSEEKEKEEKRRLKMHSKELDLKAQPQKVEVDFDGIDKDSDEEDGYVDDARGEEGGYVDDARGEEGGYVDGVQGEEDGYVDGVQGEEDGYVDGVQGEEDGYDEIKKNIEDASNETVDADSSVR